MTTIRRIVTSQVDGNDANTNNDGEIRPFGETAIYLDTNGPVDKPVLAMHDGIRTHIRSKVLGPGVLYGSNADAGDGSNADTIKLIPDALLYDQGSNQYIVVDPTGGEPGHIHLRAGGTQDASSADLYLGGELTCVRISDTSKIVTVRTTNIGDPNITLDWSFQPDGNLYFPGIGNTRIGESEPGLVVSSDASVVLQSNNNGESKELIFGTDGSITLPGNSIIDSSDNNIEIRTTNNFNVEATNVVNIFTDSQGTAYQWQFGDDGNLILPGNITSTTDQSIQLESKYNLSTPGQEITADDNQGTESSDFINVWIEGSGGTDYPGITAVQPGWTVTGPGLTNDIITNVETITYAPGMSVYKMTTTTTSDKNGYTYTFTEPPTLSVETNTWNFGTNGTLTLPGGATVRDLPGVTTDDSVLILGAGVTIAENQRAARIGINGSVEGVSIGAGANDWSFTNDGTLTFPGGMTIATESGGDTRLIVDGGNNYVEIKSNSAILVGSTSNSNVQIGNPEGGTLTEIISERVKFLLQSVPAHSTGSPGDEPGLVAFDNNHMYYCTGLYGQTGHQIVVAADYLGRTSLNTNGFQLTKNVDTLQITVGDIISDSDGGATSTVVTVTSDENYVYVGTGGVAYAAQFPLTFTSTDYVAGGNIWKRVAWSGDTW